MNQYTPDQVSPPGETLLECIENLGLSRAEFAQRTNISLETINGIISGELPITREIAIDLDLMLGVSVEFWLAREQHYRERKNEQR